MEPGSVVILTHKSAIFGTDQIPCVKPTVFGDSYVEFLSGVSTVIRSAVDVDDDVDGGSGG